MRKVIPPFHPVPQGRPGAVAVERSKGPFLFWDRLPRFLILFCLLVNSVTSLAPAYDSGGSAFSRVEATKQALCQLGNACVLPVAEVGDAVGREAPLSAGFKSAGKDDLQPRPSDLINGFAQRVVLESRVNGYGICHWSGPDKVFPGSFNISAHQWPPGEKGFVYLLFLMFLVILLRSTLPWETVAVRVKRE